MSTTISKLSLHLSANVDGVKSDLEKATAATKAFDRKISALPDVGEKINSSFGRILSTGNVFQNLDSDVSGFEKTLTAAGAGLSSLVVGMQIATKVASGFKAALIGTGIGAIVVGLGFLVGKLTSAREDSKKEREDWQKWLDRIETRALRPAVTPRATGAWDIVTLEEARRDRAAREAHSRELARREALMRPVAELGIETDRLAGSLDEMAHAAGRSGDALSIFRLETRATAMGLDPLIRGSDTYARILADLERARAAATTLELRRETERLRTPLEMVNDELARMASLLRRGGDFELFRRGISGLIGAPEVDAMRGRVDTIIAAFRSLAAEREALVTRLRVPVPAPGVRRFFSEPPLAPEIRDEALRHGIVLPEPAPRPARPLAPDVPRALREGFGRIGIVLPPPVPAPPPPAPPAPIVPDAARAVDSLATLAGDTPGPLAALRARMDSIDRAARAAREIDARAMGGRGFFPFASPGVTARFERASARAFLDAERSLGMAADRMAPQALLEGTVEAVSAINAARRNARVTDPMARVERVLERLERIEEDERRELEGIGAVLSRGIRRV